MTSAQENLLRKAREGLQAAQVLCASGLFDFAAGRAYYAMFYAAQALLLERGLSFSKHRSTIAAFGQHFVKTGLLDPQLHRNLRQAFDKRIVGDYDANTRISATDATSLVKQGEEFLAAVTQLLDQLSQPSVSSQAGQAPAKDE